MDRFFDGKRISIGLWKELYNFASLYGVECEIINIKDYLNLDFDRDIFIAFLDNLFENVTNDKGDPIYPRNYQIEGAYRALKYKFCNEELATSAGKTLIFYSYLSYLKHTGVINKNNKALLVVPNVSLVNQTVKGFDEYTNGYVKFNIMKIGGSHSFNEEEFENADLVISTYQSLIEMEPYSLKARFLELKKRRVGKKKKAEKEQKMKKLLEKITSSVNKGYFKKFSVVCIDETHKARSGSIQNIIKSCSNAEYKLGLSGTTKISEQYSDY
jgi:superfamily II DNA or RNA helicase